MYLYGDQIINDYNASEILNYLISIQAIRGRDYSSLGKNKIKVHSTEKIRNSPKFYNYKTLPIGHFQPYIGRVVNPKDRTVTDYVYAPLVKHSSDIIPYTFGWTYDNNHSSVAAGVMELVSLIPKNLRKDLNYVATFICSRIDACNDPKNGIIEGRWESSFTGGLKPSDWANSSHVFSERIRLKRPVKYGQCWVLADILTGIFNFLGLKAKAVKVTHCIMDLYDTRGIDIYDSTGDLKLKANGIFNPLEMISEDLLEYTTSEELDTPPEKITKGPVFDLHNRYPVDPKDLFNVDYIVTTNDNKSWNFHVWTEVIINGETKIFDPCPIHDAPKNFKGYSGKNGLKYFGPVPIQYVKYNGSNIPDYKYMYSCINGQLRNWSPLVIGNKTIMYLRDSRLGIPIVSYRDTLGCEIVITDKYRDTYDNFHKDHPIIMSVLNNSLEKILFKLNPKMLNSKYVIQLVLLYCNTPLYIHREKCLFLNTETFAFLRQPSVKKYRLKANKITLCVYDLDRNYFWSQCIHTS